jgi:hypothetical protein
MNNKYDEVCAGIDTIFAHYCGQPVAHPHSELVFMCPVCKKPKLGVNSEKRVAGCFVCGSKWNAVSFIEEMDNLTREKAVIKGLDILGIEPPPHVVEPEYVRAKDIAPSEFKAQMYAEIYSYLKRYNSIQANLWIDRLFPTLSSFQKLMWVDIVVSTPSINVVDILRERDWSLQEISSCPGFLTGKTTGRVRFTLQDHIIFPYFSPNHTKILAMNGRVKDDTDTEKRYRWLSGEKKHIYFPFGVGLDPEVITEGEKKAILARTMGIRTIAVAGVNCFNTPEIYELQDRVKKLYICYDREKENPNVRRAEHQLANFLSRKLGIAAPIVELPLGYKMDDFLIKFGPQEFRKLMAEADEQSPDP